MKTKVLRRDKSQSVSPVTGVAAESDMGTLKDDVWNYGINTICDVYYELRDADFNVTYAITWSDWAPSIYNILKSPYVQFCELCDPWRTDCASLNTHGKYLGFSPSLEDLDPENKDIPEVWVWDLKYELNIVDHEIMNIYKHLLDISITDIQRAACKNNQEYMELYARTLLSADNKNRRNKNQVTLVKQVRIW